MNTISLDVGLYECSKCEWVTLNVDTCFNLNVFMTAGFNCTTKHLGMSAHRTDESILIFSTVHALYILFLYFDVSCDDLFLHLFSLLYQYLK